MGKRLADNHVVVKDFSVLIVSFSIMNGICSIGNMAAFNRFGKMFFKRIIIIKVLSRAALYEACSLFFGIFVDNGGDYGIASLWNMAIVIIPDNFVEAFYQ